MKDSKSVLNGMIKFVAVGFAFFHLYTGMTGPFQDMIQRSIHVGVGISLFFLLSIQKGTGNKTKRLADFLLLIITIIASFYVIVHYDRIVMPRFEPHKLDIVVALGMVLIVLESTRRLIGWSIPILALLSVIYAYFGPYFPGIWKHNGVSLEYIMQVIYFSDRGIWGSVTGISATIIAVFVIFGSILFATGGGKAFMDLAGWLTGNSYGGAAKLASVASGLFGTISGSAGANVATTGAFTIPLMKNLGYSPEFAAGVESSASSGGQIMPPIMGAGAFIMADILGMPYTTIALAAIIPSLLFYYGVIMAIDFKARKENYRGIPRDQIPKLAAILHYKNSLPVFVPILVLIFFFSRGYTPVTSAMYAILASVVLYFLTDLKNPQTRLSKLIEALEKSSKDLLTIIALIACAQILLSMIAFTGVGVKFTNIIIELGKSNIYLAGICAMFATMVLGMGLPTVAAYLLAASVMGPALARLGIEPIAAHFFIFYFSIFAGITPPVCGTVFIGATIANANWLKTAWVAIRLSIAAYIVPFMFLQSPTILLVGTKGEIIQSIFTSTIGVTALAAGGMGYLLRNLNILERIVLCTAGLFLIDHGFQTDIIGLTAFAVILGYQLIRRYGARLHPKQGV